MREHSIGNYVKFSHGLEKQAENILNFSIHLLMEYYV